MLTRGCRLLVNPRAYITRAQSVTTRSVGWKEWEDDRKDPSKSLKEGETDLLTAARDAQAPSVQDAPPADIMFQWQEAQREMGEAYPFSWPAAPHSQPPERKYKPHPWFVDFEKGKDSTRLLNEGNPNGKGWTDKFKVAGEEAREMGLWGYLTRVFYMRTAWAGKGRKTLVGVDQFGNKYWQTAETNQVGDRFVEPRSGYFFADPSEIPRPWVRWLRGWMHTTPHEYAAFRNWPTLTYDVRDPSSGAFWRRPHMTNYQSREKSRYHTSHPHPNNQKYDHWKYTENSRFGRLLKNVWRPHLDPEVRNSPYCFGGSVHVAQQFRDRIYSGNYSVKPTWSLDPAFNK